MTGVPLAIRGVLVKSTRIKDVVEECATELVSVNQALEEGLRKQPAQPTVEGALEKSTAVAEKVDDVARNLATVNVALETEVRERQLLEHELAAAQEQEKAARHAAFHDPLTSLPNRVLFNDRLEHGLAQAKRHDWKIAVMFIDLDGFKAINDAHGHRVGDEVLQTIATRLKGMIREDDTASRHGGDEFLYLLLELGSDADAVTVAQKILQTLGEPIRLGSDGKTLDLQVGLSIGIAIYPADGAVPEDLVKNADKAMYRAKRERIGYAFAH